LKNRSWEVDVPGDGPEGAHLKRSAKELKIASRVHFPGVVSDIPRRLSESDLFCFPSRWEGQGLALLEAAGSKLPIIASDLPVFHEAFSDRSMKFVPAEDVKAWAKAIEWAMDHPMEMKKKADQAFKLAHDAFALDRMVRQHAELYALRCNSGL
jgi:glycosyltransferase involved in cell wall biosynthesis